MDHKQAERWKKTRAIGRNKYLLTYGVIAWGIIPSAILSVVEFMNNDGQINPMYVAMRVFVFATVGFFVSSAMWNSRERKFSQVAGGRS
ncbi:hypothetical protein NV379_14315 [Paenibacillus sp. N1-5-1-14]|uniref:hypothetical protein n=1 Tax=Paenibacillus radicibacter TaxID=2972488 RepID=UPI002158B33B|nr:hypothetical protein [Paenibacillus radicibacter]MCR8643826.1 hypothetical protein [Paenibacillus radicibacter]